MYVCVCVFQFKDVPFEVDYEKSLEKKKGTEEQKKDICKEAVCEMKRERKRENLDGRD